MKEKVCAYCGKKIGSKECYGVLGSGLLTHEKCYRPAFTSKTWKARKFRIKNWFMYQGFKIGFLIGFLIPYFRYILGFKAGGLNDKSL